MSTVGKTVLIIEDEVALSKALFMRLRSLEYRPVEAHDGQKGIELYEKVKPDLVLVDLVMPNMSGYDVIFKLRNDLQSDVPIIVLTNIDRSDSLDRAMKAGADAYFIKSSTSLEQLEGVLKQVLS